MYHYMLSKCLWKMLTRPDEESRRRVAVQEVLETCAEAIEHLPARKDSRADHILEPHFKIVSIAHKLVNRKLLTPLQGSQAVQMTPWARNVKHAEDEEEWEPFVLEVLRKIGHADKSNWHHRIISRAAHVIYDAEQNRAGALGAKHEFTQQIFTKTMTIQVWKPDFERAGRHFVYTSRYVIFFVKLLNQLNDRASLDQLIRRIRRKSGDFLNHQQVWDQVMANYVDLSRRLAKVPINHDEAVFRSIEYDEFVTNARVVEAHYHESETFNLVLDILRDTIEVKKLNNSLTKGTLFDELIVDCYASLYQSFVATLPLKKEAGVEARIALDGNVDSPDASEHHGNLTGRENATDLSTNPTAQNVNSVRATTPAPATKSTRAKTITRREILRKADGLIVRPPPIKTQTLTRHPTSASSRSTFAVEVPVRPGKDASCAKGVPTTATLDKLGLGLGLTTPAEGSRVSSLVRAAAETEDDVRSDVSSRPGSVHDSADDESELSEIEEMEEPDDELVERNDCRLESPVKKAPVMFPGLVQLSEAEEAVQDEEDPGAFSGGEGVIGDSKLVKTDNEKS
jgi:hypothetical protein